MVINAGDASRSQSLGFGKPIAMSGRQQGDHAVEVINHNDRGPATAK